MFFVIDYTRKTYVTCTDSIKPILGYDAREPLESGLSFTLDIAQKDYFKTLNEKVFPSTVSFLQTIPQAYHPDYVFSYNNQLRNSAGKWINILQKGSYITSKETGMPLYCLGMVLDINACKKSDTTVVHTIERIDSVTKIARLIETNYFLSIPRRRIANSPREKYSAVYYLMASEQ